MSAYVGTVRFFAHHHWLVRAPRTRPIALRELRVARVWIRVIRRELAETRAQLQPRVVAGPSWLWNAFMCIHSHEGSWTDDGAPYWGGLQFGWSEWQRFGGNFAPSANLATPAEQIAAGIAYWRVAGFSPWPNTARMCGLL